MTKYLEEYVQSYEIALKNSKRSLPPSTYALLKKHRKTVTALCNDILAVFELYDDGNMVKLYTHFNQMMKKIVSYLTVLIINDCNYFRVRSGSEVYSRKGLFHIPFDKRYLVKSYRYSTPGFPCLYLSEQESLCWLECGLPKDFSISQYKIVPNSTQIVKVIDFSQKPLHYSRTLKHKFINYSLNQDELNQELLNYLIAFPLHAACSLSVKNRDVAFVEEYVFPQLLTSWIKTQKDIDGIAYITSSRVPQSTMNGGYNLVLPTRNFDEKYCKYLNSICAVSEPVKVTLKNILPDNFEVSIKTVNEYISDVQYKQRHSLALEPSNEIISICRTFLLLCESLQSNQESQAYSQYQMLETIVLTAGLIKQHHNEIKKSSLCEAQKLFMGSVEDEAIKIELDSILDVFIKKIIPIITDVSYIDRKITPLVYSSNGKFEQII